MSTSFPLHEEAVSGPFVRRLVENLPAEMHITVVTPCGEGTVEQPGSAKYLIRCFRYAPRRWQKLAHGSGGIPAALKQSSLSWLLLIPFSIAMFLACVRAARSADLIHANWSVTGVIAGLAGLFTRTPLITTLRGTDVSGSSESLPMRMLLKSCFRLSDRLVTVGQGIREEANRILDIDPTLIRVIHNGVDATFFGLSPPDIGGILRLITVGSLVEVKGLDTILRALSLLPNDVQWELTLAGDGPQRSRLEDLGRDYGILPRLRFLGAIPPQQIPDLLKQSQVFLLASRAEGRPNAMLEALAGARAVVASRIPAITELLCDGRTGVLFEPDNAQELADQLQRLYRNRSLVRSLGAQGRESVANLSWQDTGRAYAALYEELLSEGKRECAA